VDWTLIDSDAPNWVYVDFEGKDESSLQSAIYDWLDPHGHSLPGHRLIWSDHDRGIDKHLLGKWMCVVRPPAKYGIWDYTDYDPKVVLLFKLAWGGVARER